MSTKWFLEFSINADGFARRPKIGQSTKKLKLFLLFFNFYFCFSDLFGYADYEKNSEKVRGCVVKDLVESEISVKPGKDWVNLELFGLNIETRPFQHAYKIEKVFCRDEF